MRLTGILSLVFGAMALAAGAQAQVPAGYPADYKAIVDGAKKEGKVVVYSTTDAKLVTPLIKDFEAAFPGVKVEYTDLNSTEVYNRYISESAAKAASADAVWSSSMDLQMKLAADGLAAVYKSPEAAALPAWAHWKDTIYATTFEPIAIVYNKRLVPPEDVPKTHADLAKLLNTKATSTRTRSPPTTRRNRVSASCSPTRTPGSIRSSGIWSRRWARAASKCSRRQARCWSAFPPARICWGTTCSGRTRSRGRKKTRRSASHSRPITTLCCRG